MLFQVATAIDLKFYCKHSARDVATTSRRPPRAAHQTTRPPLLATSHANDHGTHTMLPSLDRQAHRQSTQQPHALEKRGHMGEQAHHPALTSEERVLSILQIYLNYMLFMQKLVTFLWETLRSECTS